MSFLRFHRVSQTQATSLLIEKEAGNEHQQEAQAGMVGKCPGSCGSRLRLAGTRRFKPGGVRFE